MSHYHITQEDRQALLRHPEKRSFRKRSRIIAVRADRPFIVETDRGPMTGKEGDWIVTNHPADDPESDLWTISAERMDSTYEEITE